MHVLSKKVNRRFFVVAQIVITARIKVIPRKALYLRLKVVVEARSRKHKVFDRCLCFRRNDCRTESRTDQMFHGRSIKKRNIKTMGVA